MAGEAIEIRFVGHATVRLEVGGLRILTDPFLRQVLGPLQRHGPIPDAAAVTDVDLVLISHGHPDHFDPASLRAIDGAPTVVVPRGLGSRARRTLRGDVVEVEAGDRLIVDGVQVEAVTARHWISPGAPRARPIGYMVESDSRVYFAGDTGRFDGLDGLVAAADIALLPVWTWGPHLGPGHLGPRAAAEVLRSAGPTVAIPIHWGTLYPRRLHHVWQAPLREPADRFAAHAARLAPEAEIRILRPGDATIIGSTAPPDDRR